MIIPAFGAVTLIAALLATFLRNTKAAILALWVAGLAAGGLYLTLGAETLAVMQWIVSTLVAISFVFFSIMFGEFAPKEGGRSILKAVSGAGAFVLIGIVFAGVVWIGVRDLGPEIPTVSGPGNDLAALGRSVADDHFLALEILAMTFFLVLVGGGVVARPERERSDT